MNRYKVVFIAKVISLCLLISPSFTTAGSEDQDFNNDSGSDILWRNDTNGANYIWHLAANVDYTGVEFAVLGGTSVPAVSDPNWQIAGVADFNQDNRPDILWKRANYNPPVFYVWYMQYDDFQPFPTYKVIGFDIFPSPGDPDWEVVALGDFDNDRDVDLIFEHRTTNAHYGWLMDYTSGISFGSGFPVPSPNDKDWKVVGAAGFNMNDLAEGTYPQDYDDTDDIVWRHQIFGHNWVMGVYVEIDETNPFGPWEPEFGWGFPLPIEPDTDFKLQAIIHLEGGTYSGCPELVYRNDVSGETKIVFLYGNAVRCPPSRFDPIFTTVEHSLPTVTGWKIGN